MCESQDWAWGSGGSEDSPSVQSSWVWELRDAGSRAAGTSDLQLTLARVTSVSLGSQTYTQVHLPRGLFPGEGDSPTAAVLRDQLLLCEAGLQGQRRLL